MASWDSDPIVEAANSSPGGAARGKPWESDPKTDGQSMVVQPDLGFVPAFGPLLRALGYDGQVRKAADGYQPSSVPILDPISTFANRAVEAVPIIGKPIADLGRSIEERAYGEAPGTRQEIETGNAAQYPIAATAGDVTGTVAPIMIAGGTTLGGQLLGMTGKVGARVAAGSVSGAALAGTDELVRSGGDVGQALDKAKWGAILGGSLPVAERLVGTIVRAATGNSLQPAEKALAAAMEADGLDIRALAQKAQELGPDAVMADLGPNLQRLAGALASLPGPAQSLVRKALGVRANSTNSRIIADTNEILGPAPVPSRVDATIQTGQRDLGPRYETVFREKAISPSWDFDATIPGNRLNEMVDNSVGHTRSRLEAVQRMVVGPDNTYTPDPSTWFQVRQELDGMIGAETNATTRGRLADLRRIIDDDLGAQVPGLKGVDAQYEELARQRDALGTGQQALDSGRTAMRPEELTDAMNAVPERGIGPSAVPFRLSQGARAEIERIIGTTANDLNALKTALKGDGSWNRDRLVTLFGQDKANKLLAVLEREKAFDTTNRIVTQNSETAARLSMQDEVGFADPKRLNDTTMTGLALMGAQKLANVGARMRRSGTNQSIAEALVGPAGMTPTRQKAVEEALLENGRRSILPPAAVAQALLGPSGW